MRLFLDPLGFTGLRKGCSEACGWSADLEWRFPVLARSTVVAVVPWPATRTYSTPYCTYLALPSLATPPSTSLDRIIQTLQGSPSFSHLPPQSSTSTSRQHQSEAPSPSSSQPFPGSPPLTSTSVSYAEHPIHSFGFCLQCERERQTLKPTPISVATSLTVAP